MESTVEQYIEILRQNGQKVSDFLDEYDLSQLALVVDIEEELPSTHDKLVNFLDALTGRSETRNLLGLGIAL